MMPKAIYFGLGVALACSVTMSAIGAESGTKFRDCRECPEMIVVPAGNFVMGSPPSEIGRQENEGPQHRVEIPAFATGIYPVTKAEYANFVQESGYKSRPGCTVWTGRPFDQRGAIRTDFSKDWRRPGFEQSDRDPVVCVSWDDAQAYIGWLNHRVQNMQKDRTRTAYRLLSEAEWEYATRAGTNTPYYWGTKISHDNANYGLDHCPPCGPFTLGRDRWKYTSPVGSFPPNSLGLYDMSGNVFQWLEDCWHKDYVGAPTNGAAWTTGDCKFRVDRGGDWFDDPLILRAAYRDLDEKGAKDYFSGFRVAKTLN